jgi:tetratricopeptide (TPR) repeat protein
MRFLKWLFGRCKSGGTSGPTHTGDQERPKTSRDYGRELRAQHRTDDLISGVRFVCVLDEHTCLTCLQLDGSETPPGLPIHEGCRCITVPIMKSWRQLGIDIDELPGTRSSDIGQIATDGGLYKAYLIERARVLNSGKQGKDFVAQMKARLPAMLQAHPGESQDVVATVEAAILHEDPNATPDDAVRLLRKIRWNASNVKALLETCVQGGQHDEILSALARMVRQVPTGPYALRHKGMLYRTAAQVSKKYSLSAAIEYLQQAAKLDSENPAVFLELGKLLRRIDHVEEARASLERALQLNPTLKSAQTELDKLR